MIGSMGRNGRRDRRGQGYAEYGLILVLVALGCFLASMDLGETVRDFYNEQSDRIDAVAPAAPAAPESP